MSKTSQISYLFENLLDLKKDIESADTEKEESRKTIEELRGELEAANAELSSVKKVSESQKL